LQRPHGLVGSLDSALCRARLEAAEIFLMAAHYSGCSRKQRPASQVLIYPVASGNTNQTSVSAFEHNSLGLFIGASQITDAGAKVSI
jgi:hypothetical protein